MALPRFILSILLIIFFINYSYAIFVEEGAESYFYTNNPQPNIDIKIELAAEPLTVKNASLIIGDSLVDYKVFEQLIPFGGKGDFSFKINRDISNLSSAAYFKLYVYGEISKYDVNFFGSPSEFRIRYDGQTPQIISDLTNNIIKSADDYNELIKINEKISSYNIFLNGRIVKSYVGIPSQDISQYKDFILINNLSNLIDGANDLKITFKDLAGNENSAKYELYYIGSPLTIDLLTKKNDSSLKYFYDVNYKGLFDGKIYSTQENFDLKIKSSKPAQCYMSTGLFNFKEFNDISNSSLKKLISANGIEHKISVNSNGGHLWLACVVNTFPREIVYLSETMGLGKVLIPIEIVDSTVLDFTIEYPISEIISEIFDINLKSNKKAACFYSLNGAKEVPIPSSDYLFHEASNVQSVPGDHTLKYRCFDVLGNDIEKTRALKINPKLGFKILDYSPKYSSTSSVTVNLDLNLDIECKYSSDNKITPQSYASLSPLSGTGLTKSFSASGLIEGEDNFFFIFCNKDDTLVSDSIKIIFDPNGPQIYNFSFVNNGVKSDYLASKEKMKIEFEINSSIEIANYTIEFIGGDEPKIETFQSRKASFKDNLSLYTAIRVYATNKAGIKGNIIQKSLIFDLDQPIISFPKSSGKVKIICADSTSSCDRVYYGFSLSPLNCNAKIHYPISGNTSIEFGKNNYICADAYDKVGNKASSFESLFSNTAVVIDNPDNFDINDSDGDNNIIDVGDSDTNESDDNNEIDYIDNGDDDLYNPGDFENGDNSNSSTYWLVAAIVLVLFGISGGGYYAYKKGYLNEQLKKMGFKVPNQTQNNNLGQTQNGAPYYTSNINKNNLSGNANNKRVKISNYDKQLEKLNKFVNEKISSDNAVYDKFKKSSSQDTSSEDSLMRKKEKVSSIDEEDFDEFYAKSRGELLDKEASKSIEKEAEEFEKFYEEDKNKKELEKDSEKNSNKDESKSKSGKSKK
ncbi:MAG: hypothetical protein KC589_08065 [Nanoarchaeota archaeon]|nr:hypothetical protein [Nanoarchaeota archaeon]